ncbi:MAG: FtsK/SpoIIIE domain-containing protein [Micromonosporaceae bacterium]
MIKVEDSAERPELGAVAASRLPAVRVPGEVATRDKPPAAEAEQPGIGKQLRRHWRALAPLAATGGLVAVAELLHASANGLQLALFGGAALVAAGALYVWRKLATRAERTWAIGTLAGAWVTGLVGTWLGTAPPVAGLMWLAGAILAAPWWWRHRADAYQPAAPAPAPQPEPEPAPEPESVRILQTWAQHVATQRGALAKSRLGEPIRFRYGWRASIGLERGVHVTSDAIAATPRILSAYEAAAGEVYIDAHPTGQLHLALLVVLTSNPLRESTSWAGPTLDQRTGSSTLGPYADGSPTRYRWWAEIGPIHDLIAGTSGAGKSALLNLLLAEERASDLMTTVLIDPQAGQSVPDWPDHVHRFAGDPVTGLELLQRVERAMYDRNHLLANLKWVDEQGRERRGLPKWYPGCGLPLMVVTIEEAHAVLDDPDAAQAAERIAKMARKCGIKLRLIVQDPSVTQIGNSRVLRSQLTGGNVIVLRTGDRLSGQIATGGRLPVDPYDIPAEWPNGGGTTAGVGYLIGAEQRGAMMRVRFVDDAYGWATKGSRSPEHPIDAAAFGDVAKPGASHAPTLPSAPPRVTFAGDLERATVLNPAMGELTAALNGLAQVIPFQRRSAAQPERPSGRTVADQVLTLLADRQPWRTDELRRAIGCSDRQVRNALDQLRDQGLVESTGDGVNRRHQLVARTEHRIS